MNTFDAQCAQLDGLVQFHAHCGGYNLCRGQSYDSDTEELSEHTCRGLNTCAGMSCVELPSDRKREAAALYARHCASCHGEGGAFELPTPTGSNPEAEAARLAAESTLAKSAAIAFGEDGEGIALDVQHAFYRELSRAEVLRLVAYIDALPVQGGSRAAPKRL
jgi:cytochrome c553